MAQATTENPPASAGKAAGKTTEQNPTGSKSDPNGNSTTVSDPIAMLREDHRRVEQLFQTFEKSTNAGEQSHLAEEICKELMVHTLLEEEIFYPACHDHMEEKPLNEAQVEHDGAKILIREIQNGSPDDKYFAAKVKVLAEEIKHHVQEEEKPGQGIFAKAKAAGLATAELAQRLAKLKQELLQKAEAGALGPPETRSFRAQTNPGVRSTSQENAMARGAAMEHDSRGRFVSEDEDDRDYRRSRGRMPTRDDEGRFTSRSRYEDDDDGYRSRSRGHGGWYGDPEGHSEASQRGWDERGGIRSRSRYEDDDDD